MHEFTAMNSQQGILMSRSRKWSGAKGEVGGWNHNQHQATGLARWGQHRHQLQTQHFPCLTRDAELEPCTSRSHQNESTLLLLLLLPESEYQGSSRLALVSTKWGGVRLCAFFTFCRERWALPPGKIHAVGNSLNVGRCCRCLAAKKVINDNRMLHRKKAPYSVNFEKCQA